MRRRRTEAIRPFPVIQDISGMNRQSILRGSTRLAFQANDGYKRGRSRVSDQRERQVETQACFQRLSPQFNSPVVTPGPRPNGVAEQQRKTAGTI